MSAKKSSSKLKAYKEPSNEGSLHTCFAWLFTHFNKDTLDTRYRIEKGYSRMTLV